MGSLPKLLLVLSLCLFGAIGVAYKGKNTSKKPAIVLSTAETAAFEIDLSGASLISDNLIAEPAVEPVIEAVHREALVEVDCIEQVFSVADPKAPFVKTLAYKSRVSWLQGRPAWVADYARHFKTSRHFIARSLNGKTDYWTQNVSNGDRFNVIDPDSDVCFHLVVDIERCKALFYSYSPSSNERILLKTYSVGLGRPSVTAPSGCLTPLGTYELGERIAIYKPKATGWYNGDKVEMVRIFGTRWIPFEKEVANCTAPAKGFGIHGAPWVDDLASGELLEVRSCIGQYESDGCIRFVTEDIEEIFAIVITRPTTIEIVKSFEAAELPGREVAL